jgi:hypothetical protein
MAEKKKPAAKSEPDMTMETHPGAHPLIAAEAISTHAKTGGSTFDPRTGEDLAGKRGFAVGVSPESAHISDRPLTPQEYSGFVAMHHDMISRHPNVHVGTSHDTKTGLHHMEMVTVTPSKGAALNMAHHLGEDHTYNLETGEKQKTHALLFPHSPKPVSHMSPDQRIKEVAAQTPQKEPYSGTHFSDERHDGMIEGARRGAPDAKGLPSSADAARLRLGSKTQMGDDAPAGFYSYRSGSIPEPGVAARKHSHQVRGHFAFGSTESPEFKQGYQAGAMQAKQQGADDDTAHKLGLNTAEHHLKNAGYDGYSSPRHPDVHLHFGDHEAVPNSPKQIPNLEAKQGE